MKKLLILTLLLVGCDYAPTKHTHEKEIHPLVGVWEAFEENTTWIGGEFDGLTNTSSYGENSEWGTLTLLFGEDKVYSWDAYLANVSMVDTGSGTWSATDNKLTVIIGEDTFIWEYAISGNILTVVWVDMVHDGVQTTEIRYEKQ